VLLQEEVPGLLLHFSGGRSSRIFFRPDHLRTLLRGFFFFGARRLTYFLLIFLICRTPTSGEIFLAGPGGRKFFVAPSVFFFFLAASSTPLFSRDGECKKILVLPVTPSPFLSVWALNYPVGGRVLEVLSSSLLTCFGDTSFVGV